MVKIAVLLLLLFTHLADAQTPVSFSTIDERVKSIDPAPPAELANTLTKDYTSEKEKLRSIFSWITEHIAYRVRKNYTGIRAAGRAGKTVLTDTSKWKSGNDFVAETVLQNQTAVCDGYARLFKTLCDYAGLHSAIVSGFAKGDLSRQPAFRCNHSWNAVYVDSAWYLLDVTWASGYTNYSGDQFTKRYDEAYFLPAPQDFIRDHFPDDLRWSLLEKPSVPHEFNSSPYRNKSFSKYNISGYTPAAGVIEANIGDTIHLDVETGDPEADKKMTTDTVTTFDDSLQKLISSVAFVEPSATGSRRHLLYNFYVADDTIEWLQIVYNHDNIMRYRLKIKKEKIALASGKKSE